MLFEGVVAVVAELVVTERSRGTEARSPRPHLGFISNSIQQKCMPSFLKPNFWLLSFLTVTNYLNEKREVY
jgi:hypothetical protein